MKIDVTHYFEVRDAEVFGGEGSVGYTTAKYENCDPQKVLAVLSSEEKREEYMLVQRKLTARLLSVPVESIKSISQEEYKANTEDEDEEEAPVC